MYEGEPGKDGVVCVGHAPLGDPNNHHIRDALLVHEKPDEHPDGPCKMGVRALHGLLVAPRGEVDP